MSYIGINVFLVAVRSTSSGPLPIWRINMQNVAITTPAVHAPLDPQLSALTGLRVGSDRPVGCPSVLTARRLGIDIAAVPALLELVQIEHLIRPER